MRLGKDTANVVSSFMGSCQQPEPVVGMGATVLMWTDRCAGTIGWVSASGHKLVVQEDAATRTDANGMSDSQEYAYAPDPDGKTWVFTRRRDGKYREKGGRTGLGLGYRRKFHDFSF